MLDQLYKLPTRMTKLMTEAELHEAYLDMFGSSINPLNFKEYDSFNLYGSEDGTAVGHHRDYGLIVWVHNYWANIATFINSHMPNLTDEERCALSLKYG